MHKELITSRRFYTLEKIYYFHIGMKKKIVYFNHSIMFVLKMKLIFKSTITVVLKKEVRGPYFLLKYQKFAGKLKNIFAYITILRFVLSHKKKTFFQFFNTL